MRQIGNNILFILLCALPLALLSCAHDKVGDMSKYNTEYIRFSIQKVVEPSEALNLGWIVQSDYDFIDRNTLWVAKIRVIEGKSSEFIAIRLNGFPKPSTILEGAIRRNKGIDIIIDWDTVDNGICFIPNDGDISVSSVDARRLRSGC